MWWDIYKLNVIFDTEVDCFNAAVTAMPIKKYKSFSYNSQFLPISLRNRMKASLSTQSVSGITGKKSWKTAHLLEL
jgi:hypothetical protein